MTTGKVVALGVAVAALVIAGASGVWTQRPPTTWLVQDGETRTYSPSELVPGGSFSCSDLAGGTTPRPGESFQTLGGGGYAIATAADGTVTVTCWFGPLAG